MVFIVAAFFYEKFSDVFHMVPKTHAGHMKAVKNLILDGTSKWLAKIFITGKNKCLLGNMPIETRFCT